MRRRTFFYSGEIVFKGIMGTYKSSGYLQSKNGINAYRIAEEKLHKSAKDICDDPVNEPYEILVTSLSKLD